MTLWLITVIVHQSYDGTAQIQINSNPPLVVRVLRFKSSKDTTTHVKWQIDTPQSVTHVIDLWHGTFWGKRKLYIGKCCAY